MRGHKMDIYILCTMNFLTPNDENKRKGRKYGHFIYNNTGKKGPAVAGWPVRWYA